MLTTAFRKSLYVEGYPGTMSSRILVVVLFALVAVTPTNVAAKPHIVIGKTAEPHSQPWLLNMKYSSGGHMCGASLIRVPYSNDSSDIALTAAHCVGDPMPPHACNDHKRTGSSYEVVASDHDQWEEEKGEMRVRVMDSVCHPDWKPPPITNQVDIAVVKLSKPLKFSETIQPIELPRQDEDVPKDAQCIAAGWGKTKYTIDEISGRPIHLDPARYLQEVPIEGLTKCYETGLCYDVVHNRTMLEGDSGSSLICKRGEGKALYGVVSGGDQKERHKPIVINIFVKVSAFTNWIEEQIGKLNAEG